MTSQTAGRQPDVAVSLVARIRAEHAAHQDKSAQALLLHECAVLEEASGEEPSAARDYLAAFNTDAQFREPLEALVRILTRRKSIKNLGKLLDALTRAAVTPEERMRAFWERAAYLEAHEQNLAGAKELFEEAISASPEDPAPWLELELCSAKDGDAVTRMRAIEARAELATDPTWKALLHMQLAELSAAGGNTARAYELVGAASALEGRARFRTQLVLEQIAAKEGSLETLARALEGQADLIEEAIDDGARGDATGVPRSMRRPEHAADAWFRAASIHHRIGDEKTAAVMIERAGRRLPESSAITQARIAVLEAAGDVAGAAALAKAELGRGITGPSAAALWLRVADSASLAKDRDGALHALHSALAADPGSIPALALELDRLGDGKDPAALAAAIDASAAVFSVPASKGRASLLAAWVWGAEAGDSEAARKALARAAECGVPAMVHARVARTLAALRGDATWYEEATEALLAAGPDVAEEPSLWLELGRSKLLRGDGAGAGAAFAKLAESGPAPAPWLGRALGVYAVGLAAGRGEQSGKPRPPETIEALASVESDPVMARALRLVGALRSARAGDATGARDRLRELHRAAPEDQVVAIFLAELERRAGDLGAAAVTLEGCAEESRDPDFAAALRIEAALLHWKVGARPRAIEALEAARDDAPRAGAIMLAWALCDVDPDTIDGRRRALDAAAAAGAETAFIALERFGLESATGDPMRALAALEELEAEGDGDFAVAAALGRILWPSALEHRVEVDHALDRLEERGGDAAALASAERFRLARAVDQDRALASVRAEAWAAADPQLYAALEWIGASMAAGDREAEVAARRSAATHFAPADRAALEASAALVAMLDQPTRPQSFVQGDAAPALLINLELALPGCDPRRRAAALHGLGTALGEESQLDGMALGAWSDLAAGSLDDARTAFRTVLEHRPKDLACWEGVRSASEALGDHVQTALACAQLGALCSDAGRGAEFWEKAGTILLEHTSASDDAEIAFARAFERDPRRAIAFDKLFRAVRARNEDARLLDIIEKRLAVAEDEKEIGKLYWERARVLRKQGDLDAALATLEDVTMLEPDHVGALALMGEICITKGKFAEAAPHLARLATIEEAPKQQRLMSGIAAVDLFENKLGDPQKALEVLAKLHAAGLSNLPVRERLARVAARAGAWSEATSILESLMRERDKREGRIEAARLGMTIWRDKLGVPVRAEAAVAKLLDEAPDDAEAIEFVLATPFDSSFKIRVLSRAKQTVLAALTASPFDAVRVDQLAKIAAFGQDLGLRQATLGCLVALGRDTPATSEELARLDARVATEPQITLDAHALADIADKQDTGPLTELFPLLAETISLALGPSAASLGVTKKDRIDARSGNSLRSAIAKWMGALGVPGEFELYVGGPDPHAVHGIAGELPTLVLGSGIVAPLDASARSAVAREVLGLRRGITAVGSRDDATIASIVAAASIEAGLNVLQPSSPMFGEVSRQLKKEMSRKTRKAILETCQRIQASGQDANQWAAAARRTLDRIGVIAAGDVSIVLGAALGKQRTQLGGVIPENERARALFAFVLSPSYLELRKKLGMGVR